MSLEEAIGYVASDELIEVSSRNEFINRGLSISHKQYIILVCTLEVVLCKFSESLIGDSKLEMSSEHFCGIIITTNDFLITF